jgi:hypothetical protein
MDQPEGLGEITRQRAQRCRDSPTTGTSSVVIASIGA